MCVNQECAWCQCQILVLALAYPTLHKCTHSNSKSSCVSTGNVGGASAKYWSQHQHIQHYTNTPTVLIKLYVCPLGMCVVLVPSIGISTSISHIAQKRPQHFRHFMCVNWECAWCNSQIFLLAPAYPTLHKYAQITSETSCVSTGNVRGASAKYWYQHQHIQHYTNTPTELRKLHVCPLEMCVVLLPNIGISTSISNTTHIRPQYFRNFMCVHQECAWCQCQIVVLAPAYPTLHKYAHRSSERSCVSTGNVRGASAKYWYQHQHIQHYTNILTVLMKIHVCLLGMCVVLVPNIGISTSISNTAQKRPLHFRNFICFNCECAWCQYQILVLAPAYPTVHKYAHSTSGTSCVSTGNVRCASAKYQFQHQHIQHYTNTPTVLMKLMCVYQECVWCQCQILVLAPAYPTLHKCTHSNSKTSCVSTGNVRGASAKYQFQHQHIQHYTNTPTVLMKIHVCLLGMCVVLVPNIGISTSISNTTQMYSQQFKNFMCVHWDCGWCQFQILVLAQAYPTLHKYTHSTYEISCVSTRNVRGASAKYWYQHELM